MSDGAPIAYSALEPGTPIVTSDGAELGRVERVVENAREHAPGAPEFRANVKAGRLGRFLGGGWRRS